MHARIMAGMLLLGLLAGCYQKTNGISCKNQHDALQRRVIAIEQQAQTHHKQLVALGRLESRIADLEAGTAALKSHTAALHQSVLEANGRLAALSDLVHKFLDGHKEHCTRGAANKGKRSCPHCRSAKRRSESPAKARADKQQKK